MTPCEPVIIVDRLADLRRLFLFCCSPSSPLYVTGDGVTGSGSGGGGAAGSLLDEPNILLIGPPIMISYYFLKGWYIEAGHHQEALVIP